MPTTLRILVVLATVIGSLVSSVAVGRADATARWNLLVDDYLDQILFRFNPSYGTSAGLHQYDSQLDDYSRANIDKEIAALQQFEQRVVSFDASALSSTDAADHACRFMSASLRKRPTSGVAIDILQCRKTEAFCRSLMRGSHHRSTNAWP